MTLFQKKAEAAEICLKNNHACIKFLFKKSITSLKKVAHFVNVTLMLLSFISLKLFEYVSSLIQICFTKRNLFFLGKSQEHHKSDYKIIMYVYYFLFKGTIKGLK